MKFAKIAQNWLDFSFLALILVLDKENPNFFDFLDPYTCPDLGQEESQKVGSTFWITLVETLVPTVLKCKKVDVHFVKVKTLYIKKIPSEKNLLLS